MYTSYLHFSNWDPPLFQLPGEFWKKTGYSGNNKQQNKHYDNKQKKSM